MEPFIGQIMQVGFNFAPRGWAHCNGQLLPISQNTALFSLLGTTFGGDGRTTFGLPDLRGRVSIHPGTGPGLQSVTWGEKGGANNTTLAVANIPSHNHGQPASNVFGDQKSPVGHVPAIADDGERNYAATSDGSRLAPTDNAGSGQPFSNMQPFHGIYHVIALTGIFPSRN